MSEQKVGIVAECVCDLPKSFFQEHNVDVIYFLIETDTGVFTDTDEISSENIIDYMESGGKRSLSSPPPVETYINVFEKKLKDYDEIILVSISSGISNSVFNAQKAVGQMGGEAQRVHIFDSAHLSTGLGHVVKAVELAEEGRSAEEIIAALEEFKNKVSTTFITVNADYLCRSGRVTRSVKKICDTLSVHPVLQVKGGKITLKSVLFGNYDKAYIRYVRRELKHSSKIQKKCVFITHVGCSIKMIERIKREVNKRCSPEALIVTKASATISSSCGPLTFGVLFVNE